MGKTWDKIGNDIIFRNLSTSPKWSYIRNRGSISLFLSFFSCISLDVQICTFFFVYIPLAESCMNWMCMWRSVCHAALTLSINSLKGIEDMGNCSGFGWKNLVRFFCLSTLIDLVYSMLCVQTNWSRQWMYRLYTLNVINWHMTSCSYKTIVDIIC